MPENENLKKGPSKEEKSTSNGSHDDSSGCLCQTPSGKAKRCRCCCIVGTIAILQIVIIGLLLSLKFDVKHRIHRFSECRPPIHRHYDRRPERRGNHAEEFRQHEAERAKDLPELPDPDQELK